MAARSKRSADERRLAHLREIANEGANRNCLECHQRGPTYVDMSIGSFVCTKCCGLLRGLNPPHRTKSITMTSFSDDELEFIKNRGNEFNRYVYLGTYDERSNLEKESLREEHKIREFMVQKYERKRWFVDPDIAQHKMQLDRRQRAAAEQGVSLTGGSISKPSSKPPATFATRSQPVTPAGGEPWSPPPTKTNLTPAFAAFGTVPQQSHQQIGLSNKSGNSAFGHSLLDPFQPSPVLKDQHQQQQLCRSFRHSNPSVVPLSPRTIVDPFAASSASPLSTAGTFDPFTSPVAGTMVTVHASGAKLKPPPIQTHTPSYQHQKQQQQYQNKEAVSAAPAKSSTGDFADFDAAFGSANSSESASVLVSTSIASLVPTPANAKATIVATDTTVLAQGTTGSGDAVSGTNQVFTRSQVKNNVSIAGAPSADRYAALAELDELFSGQKNELVSKPNELASVSFSSTDPWGNHQSAPVAPVNPFSPTAPTAPSISGSNNPWGSPAAPGPTQAPTSSPNPFAMAGNSWSATAPRVSPSSTQSATLGRLTPSNATTQSSGLAALTTGIGGIQLNNGRVTPTTGQWPTSNQSSTGVLSSGGLTGISAHAANSGGFPIGWNAVTLASQNAFRQTQQQLFGIGTSPNAIATRSNSTSSSCSATGSISGRTNSLQGGDWATFGQLTWPSSTTTTAGSEVAAGWPNGGAANAGVAESWPQMPTSASTPAFNARSHSPAQQNTASATSKVSGVSQSFSLHSTFGAAQWPPNGTLNGTHQTGLSNGRASSTGNPFSPNGSGPLNAARVCSTSNPFL
ncbi:hypothetical protein BIW11_05289 [Tropilaelaps mercedesae]|uniref:Arf-GAP domain-containing protein n=1 Tax=Tropilaelaps mercedesae TaxID=418985 RepID=A0A1V9Y2Y6_9ACAR|nr:hypothetical protein BIW11_05289 [Tropilaelaps mercedesae]